MDALVYKGALSTQLASGQTPYDIRPEQALIQDFFAGTTTLPVRALLAKKSVAAGEGIGEPWRVFFIYLAEILGTDDPQSAAHTAVKVQKLMAGLKESDIQELAREMSDLPGMLATIPTSRSQDPIIAAMWRIAQEDEVDP